MKITTFHLTCSHFIIYSCKNPLLHLISMNVDNASTYIQRKSIPKWSKGHSFFLNKHVCHVYETVPLGHWGTEIVPLRAQYYRQSNSAPRDTVSVPIVLSVGMSEGFGYSGSYIGGRPGCVPPLWKRW